MRKSRISISFDWENYLYLAQELAEINNKNSNIEAKLRSSISRAYYAVFCKSRNYLRDIRKVSKPEKISYYPHSFVIDKFKKAEDEKMRKIGTNLARLRSNRNKADYEDKLSSNLQSLAEYSIKLTENTLKILEEININ
ncbi:MAG: HEPN domain-containing protein [Candidatus Heimdallarchaeaceae archaeon]